MYLDCGTLKIFSLRSFPSRGLYFKLADRIVCLIDSYKNTLVCFYRKGNYYSKFAELSILNRN